MADSDLSRIVNLIMENPALIEQIKELANGTGGDETKDKIPNNSDHALIDSAEAQEDYVQTGALASPRDRRRELLCALKPYVSEKRSHAIDSMLSIVDILDVMRSK